MKHVAKVIIVDENDQYLLLERSNHPTFPYEPDLPGGIVEKGEAPAEGLVREIQEEAGITLREDELTHKYTGSKFSRHGTVYYLYEVHLLSRPEVTISWEHANFDWVSRDEFMGRAYNSKDTYLKMVYAVLSGNVEQADEPRQPTLVDYLKDKQLLKNAALFVILPAIALTALLLLLSLH